MKLVIKNAKPQKKEGFYLNIDFMHGDADNYSNEIIGPFHKKNFEEIFRIITLLDGILNHNYEGKIIRGQDFSSFDPKLLTCIDGYCDETTNFCICWPKDHVYDGGIGAWLDGYSFYYIDYNGKKFDVELEK